MSDIKYFAPSVDMASNILTFLSRYKTKKSSLTEISNALELNKSTCLRVLKTLERHNLIFFEEASKKYSLGIGAVVLGSRAQENLEYLQYVRPYLKQLIEQTGLMAVFVERVSYNRLMFVAKEQEESEGTNLNVAIGNKFPITSVGYGKWFLSYMGEQEREDILSLSNDNGNNECAYNITNLEELKNTRVMCTVKDNLFAVSAPIVGSNNSILGVIAVIGIDNEESSPSVEYTLQEVKKVGIECSFKFEGHVFMNYSK